MSITTIAILVIVVGTVLGAVGDAQVAIPKKREELRKRREELECKSEEFKLQLSMKDGAPADIENPYEKLIAKVDEDLAKLEKEEKAVSGCFVIVLLLGVAAYFYFRK